MAPLIMLLVSLDSQRIRVHQVFGPMVQTLMNISFYHWKYNEYFFKNWGNWGMLLIFLESFQWSIGDIKSWVIFVPRNLIINENQVFSENWRSNLG
jgi:hypothetical protein